MGGDDQLRGDDELDGTAAEGNSECEKLGRTAKLSSSVARYTGDPRTIGGVMQNKNKYLNPTERIAVAFDYPLDALEYNRNGELHPAQDHLITKEYEVFWNIYSMFLGLILLFGLAIAIVVYLDYGSVAALLVLVGMVGTLVINWQTNGKQLRALSLDLDGTEIQMTQGIVHLEGRGTHGAVMAYFVNTTHFRFALRNEKQLFAFADGEPYVLYYTSNAEVLVGAEPVEKVIGLEVNE